MSHEFNITVKKEFYPLSSEILTIGLVMMVKNEKKRIQYTLDSIVGHVDCMIIYDTGSTDNTIDIIKKHADKHKINLYLIEGEFVDFSTSRNVVLNFADTIDVKFLLLMDTNDELKGGDKLRRFITENMNSETTGYLICQNWWFGKFDKYYNIRFVKNRTGWRYKGCVHEWISDTTSSTDQPSHPVIRIPDDIILYQDRTKDDDKTSKRFKRDRKLLLAAYKDNPTDSRTLFYLAQTCSCMGLNEESLYYYKLRSDLEGFQEEKFHSFLRSGNLAAILRHSWYDVMSYYMKAIEHSNRAEPYVKIAHHYINEKKYEIATGFARMACELEYPDTCILFVDKKVYDYDRWHLLGISAYYVGKYELGKIACLKAIEAGYDKELDTNNLKFYLDREKNINNKKNIKTISPNNNKVTKKQFIQQKIDELTKQFPDMKPKQIRIKSNLLWKRRKNKH